MAVIEQINPRLLVWARETAGLTVDEAAEKLGLTSSSRSTSVEKLAALETGERAPTAQQLLRAAATYRRPLVAFYLPEPPGRGERGEDFRVVQGTVSERENGILDALLRDLKARQQLLRGMLSDDEEARPLAFVGASRVGQGSFKIAAAIRVVLEVTEEEQRAAKGAAALFALLRTACEKAGIYVLLLGDVGSHHSDIGENVFRGIALADEIAPFIVINDNDTPAARSFTLIHELAHIWIGASGVSGPLQAMSANAIERFCNDVAGEFLLPSASLDRPPQLDGEFESILRVADRVAENWNISPALVTYTFASKGWIEPDTASRLFGLLAARWKRERQQDREATRDATGPSYYVVRRHRLGAALIDAVRRGLQGEIITHTKAAKILGVSPTNVAPLLRERARAI